jgi:hypothetical protein
MADVDGDFSAELCARTPDGMRCWHWTGSGFGDPFFGPAWSDARGWDRVASWSTIRLADVNGDRMADVCGRSSEGFVCHLSRGGSFGPPIAGPTLDDATGWDRPARYESLRMGDIDGDGSADLCARDVDGISCWRWDDDGFGPAVPGPPLTDAAGWTEPARGRTLRLADVTGDRRADVCARRSDGLRCWISDGTGFSDMIVGPDWTDAAGWGRPERTDSIRIAGPRPRTPMRRGDEGCGCAAPGAPGRAGWTIAPALGAVLLLRRRRDARR